jgi:hypothetical protein
MYQKFKITHGWKDNHKPNQWNVDLEGYGVIFTNNEDDYKETMKDGYLEIEVNDYPYDCL